MASPEQQAPATSAPPTQSKKSSTPAIPKGKKEVKILMLHGYTQSGPLFSAKTKALNKLLIKALSPAPLNLHPTLIFPTAPHRLRRSDIPGYIPSEDPAAQDDDDDEGDNWAWFRKDESTGLYTGLPESMQTLASTIHTCGGIDGILGFSQGGCVAALVTAALEQHHHPPPPSSPHEVWLSSLRKANFHAPLKFSIIYSGFRAAAPDLQWLFEPAIATPSLHFVGALDTVVDEARSKALVDGFREPVVLTHPGGHYVPVARDWVMPLAGWLRQRFVEEEKEKEKEGEVKESL